MCVEQVGLDRASNLTSGSIRVCQWRTISWRDELEKIGKMSNVSIQQAMDLLSEGLDEFISGTMKPVIGDLEWPSILSELDSMRGKDGWAYSRRDVALQLRMLTERLGNLGYPFDAGDKNRTLSSYGSVLRIVRRRWAHNDEFGTYDALAAVDTVRTVLAHIGDAKRAGTAAELRSSVLSELVEISDERTNVEDSSFRGIKLEPSTSDDQTGESSLSGAVPWEPWPVAVVGEQADLDSLRTTRVKEMVRSLIEDVVDSEGPIHKDRLAKLVGYGFGFSRISNERTKRITNQIANSSVFVDSHGFVWSQGIDISKWLIHRTNTEVQRPFEDISPVEIANAAASLSRKYGTISRAELRQKVLAQFGRKKKSKAAEKNLDLGFAFAKSTGRYVTTA